MYIRFTLSYNGSGFEGSQVQKHTKNTVMGRLYEALESLNIQTKLHASGRTDAGVHAFKQVMHCEIPDFWNDTEKLKSYFQAKLPSSIHLRQLYETDVHFHSRYGAKRRAYRYILCDGVKNPFESDFISFVTGKLDTQLLKESISLFEGEHDFGFFKKSGGAAGSDVRTIFKTRVYTYRNKTILYFEANGYLRSQIRMMVAFLLLINNKILTKEQLLEQLNCQTSYNTRPAPPNGLYLSNIIY